MNFEEALKALRESKKIARKEWNGCEYLILVKRKYLSGFDSFEIDKIYDEGTENSFESQDIKLCGDDLLAEDWEVVEE